LSGCIIDPPEVKPLTEQGDIEIVSFDMLNNTSLFLGDSFNITGNITSSSENATYILRLKMNDETLFSDEKTGNSTFNVEVTSLTNGKVNLTLYVYSKDLSKFIDTNLENNEKNLSTRIYSLGKYDFSAKNTNYSIISNEKISAIKLELKKPIYINSIGTFVRVSVPLNVDSHLIYEIVKDENGVPGNESIFNSSLQIYKLSYNWEFLLLQNPKKYIDSGTYWLLIYTDEKNFLEISCNEIETNSTKVIIGTKFIDDIKWKNTSCEPYYIVSNSPLTDTYEDFSNRFSIFNSTESNSS